MILYTSDYRKFEGMSQETVQALLTDMGLTCTFIDQAEYDAWVTAHAYA